MLAGGRHSPVERPELPRQATRAPPVCHRPEEPRRHPRSIVDTNLHGLDRRAPCRAKNDVAAAPTHDLRRSRLEPEVPYGAEGPKWIAAAAMLLADGHVVPSHEVSRM